jgi:3-hydroxyisobutyrate dehydrogenase
MEEMSSKPRVAFLGLGLMGGGMAGRLLAHKFTVAVYNRSRQKAEPFAPFGAKVSATPREAAAGADVVIAMVADDDASRNVWLGADGALAGAAPGAILIESSTISPVWVRELAAAASARGFELLDAPVTGSKPQAAAGQLLFLVGGAGAALELARPVLAVLSSEIVHFGPVGSGALVKLINNFVCGVQAVAIAEALALIERTGLDPARALAVLTEGAPGSPLVKLLSKRMTARNFSPNFLLKLMAKDLKYAIDEAGAHSVPLATASAALQTMRMAMEAGLGDKDFSAVVELLRQSNQRTAHISGVSEHA